MEAKEIKIGLVHGGEYKGWYYIDVVRTNGDVQTIDV